MSMLVSLGGKVLIGLFGIGGLLFAILLLASYIGGGIYFAMTDACIKLAQDVQNNTVQPSTTSINRYAFHPLCTISGMNDQANKAFFDMLQYSSIAGIIILVLGAVGVFSGLGSIANVFTTRE
ncbi:MAG: hypothetical protein QXI43_00230 [Candidatus Nitrosocaldus sp.]